MTKPCNWQQRRVESQRTASRSMYSRLWRLSLAVVLTLACFATILGYPSLHSRARMHRARIAKVTTSYGDGKYVQGAYVQAMQTQLEHSRRHGYQTFSIDRQILGGMWTKPAALLHIILEQLRLPVEQRVEWLLWFDADTLVLNRDTPLEMFLPPSSVEKVELLYTKDWNGLNSGVFFIKVSTWSVLYLSSVLGFSVYRPEEQLEFDEQSALEKVMDLEPFRSNVVECPSQWFNAYPHNTGLGHVENWATSASLLVHFAGEADREDKMTRWLHALESEPYRSGAHARAYESEVDTFWQQYTGAHLVESSQ